MMNTGKYRNIKIKIVPLWLIFFAGILISVSAARAVSTPGNLQNQNEQQELSHRLEELVEQLRLERENYYAQKSKYDSQIQNARANRDVLKDELDELHLQETELDNQIEEYKKEVGDIEKELVLKSNLESIISMEVQPFLTNQRTIIQNGIPYRQAERITRLEAASNSSDMNESSEISIADKLESIWNYSLEELRIGRSSETYTARAKMGDNALPYARYFRVGHLISGYITEDGKQTAMWLSQPEKEFSLIKDKKQAEQIRKAVEILDHYQPPELVFLPVTLNSEKTKEDLSAGD